jgi:hypothetical protein
MKTFQNRNQLQNANLTAGLIVQVLGYSTANGDGQAFYAIFDASQAAQLPDDRLTLANGNFAIITSIQVRRRVESLYTIASAATIQLDLKQGIWQQITLAQNITTMDFINEATINSTVETVHLKIDQDGTGGYTVAFPASIIWASGAAPVVNPNALSSTTYRFVTYDAGVSWYGFAENGDFIPVTDIGVTVLPKVEWSSLWLPEDGEDASGELYPELEGQEVIILHDETASLDEIGYAKFVIPAIDFGTYETSVVFYHSVGDQRDFNFDYDNGKVDVSSGHIRAIYYREPQDLPDFPEIKKV